MDMKHHAQFIINNGPYIFTDIAALVLSLPMEIFLMLVVFGKLKFMPMRMNLVFDSLSFN